MTHTYGRERYVRVRTIGEHRGYRGSRYVQSQMAPKEADLEPCRPDPPPEPGPGTTPC